jgi:RND superfamily putative drug exporter
MVVGSTTIDRLVTTPEGDQNTESAEVETTLETLGATTPDVVAFYDGVDINNPAFAQEVQRTDDRLTNLDGVVGVQHTYDDGPLYTSVDQQGTLVAFVLDRSLDEAAFDDLVDTVEAQLRGIEAGDTLIGGAAILDRESVEQTEADLQQAELLTLPITLVLAVVIFGGLVAATLPLVIALVAIPGALLTLWALTLVTDVQIFALSAATMLGLGLAVHYALLIVNRFREERAAGLDVDAAVTQTVKTAGVTVLFSGLTVAVALGGFLMLSGNVFPSIGMGSIGVVVIAMTAAITLLPSMLSAVGHRIKPAKSGADSGVVFYRLSTMVQRHPVVVAATVTAGLLLLAAPFLDARLPIPGAEGLPDSLETR